MTISVEGDINEDYDNLLIMAKGVKYYMLLDDIGNEIRKRLKHFDINESEEGFLNMLQEMIYEEVDL